MTDTKPSTDQVGFYFDIMCPWAYQTSVWIRDVRRQTGLAIDWRFFSLEEINRPEGKRHPWERSIAYGWTPMRVAAWLRRIDMSLCDRWYEACGRALHVEGRRFYERDVAVGGSTPYQLAFNPNFRLRSFSFQRLSISKPLA